MLVCFITCCQKYTQIYYKKLKCIKTYGDTQRTSVRPPRLGGMETGAQVLGESEPWEPPVCMQSTRTRAASACCCLSPVWPEAEPHLRLITPRTKRSPVESAHLCVPVSPSWLAQSREPQRVLLMALGALPGCREEAGRSWEMSSCLVCVRSCGYHPCKARNPA